MQIDLVCAACGEKKVRVDTRDSDERLISCQSCGKLIGTARYLRDEIAAQAATQPGS